MRFPPIQHEYVILFTPKAKTTYHLLGCMAKEQAARLQGTWRAVIRSVMIFLGGSATLERMYEFVAEGCPEKIKANPSWKAKVRQVLNSSGEYEPLDRGVWKLS